MKAAVIGEDGQLATALAATVPAGYDCRFIGLDQLNLESPEQIQQVLQDLQVDLLINAAAYTAVDKAEAEAERAHRINAAAVGEIGSYCANSGTRVIHISTDFVFDGNRATPWRPDDECHPLSVYGHSKLAGEQLLLNSGAEALVIRTAWLYHHSGNNFVATMLRLMRERESISVVADQLGTPTCCLHLAQAIWLASSNTVTGILHFADAGSASWYDFACAIRQQGIDHGLLDQAALVLPISTAEYPTAAVRPAYSVLDCTATRKLLDLPPVWWQDALKTTIKSIQVERA